MDRTISTKEKFDMFKAQAKDANTEDLDFNCCRGQGEGRT